MLNHHKRQLGVRETADAGLGATPARRRPPTGKLGSFHSPPHWPADLPTLGLSLEWLSFCQMGKRSVDFHPPSVPHELYFFPLSLPLPKSIQLPLTLVKNNGHLLSTSWIPGTENFTCTNSQNPLRGDTVITTLITWVRKQRRQGLDRLAQGHLSSVTVYCCTMTYPKTLWLNQWACVAQQFL